jgi:EmrB/QacA subfamily drug resistance transporter
VSETQGGAAPRAVLKPNISLGVVVAMSCLAQFMVTLDASIVNVALPQMRTDLLLTTAEQQWVVSGYLITLGGFLLLAARVGDLYGRKAVFLFGVIVFTAASLAGGLAQDPAALLAARIIQGIGAAALAPSSLSLITSTHTEEKSRRKALTLWSIMGGAATAVGVVLGGILTAELNWRWVLFVNIPLGVVLFIAAIATLLPAGPAAERIRLDVPGALSVTLGVGALTYGLSQASSDGWGARSVLIGLVAAGVLLVGFVVIEATSSRPLIPLSLFRPRILRIGNVLMLCMGCTMTAALFFISLYLQQAIGYSALRTGLAMVPLTIILVAGGLISRQLIPVVGARLLLIVGAIVAAGGIGWMAQLPDHPAYLAHILGPTLVAGAGIGIMLLPVTLTGTTGVSTKDAGAAAGLLNTSRQIGGAIGLAVLVNIAATATTHALRHAAATATTPALQQLAGLNALVHGYHVAIFGDAAVMLVAALAALFLPALNSSMQPQEPAREAATVET